MLRARCRRQALALDSLREAVSVLRRGVRALKAENAELRGENHRLRVPDVADRLDLRGVEMRMPLDLGAPAAARMLVADSLSGRVSELTVERAQLVVSELVSNSLRHTGGTAGRVVTVRLAMQGELCRVEVEDAGCDGHIAPRVPDLESGGGLGLNIVHTLSERWGVERAGDHGSRVWAYLAQAPERPLSVGSDEFARPRRSVGA